MMKNIVLLGFTLFVGVVSFPSYAEEGAKKIREEFRANMHKKMSGITEKMDMQERQHFYMAYTNYTMINTVETVQSNVGNAIEACGENNPDMKGALEKRFGVWNGEVNPVMKDARGNLDNMVIAQDYAPQKEIEAIFSMVDETRNKTHGDIEKIPVSTPEACQYLLDKMDETQETMVKLLRQTLVSFPQVFPNASVEEAESETESGEAEDSEADSE